MPRYNYPEVCSGQEYSKDVFPVSSVCLYFNITRSNLTTEYRVEKNTLQNIMIPDYSSVNKSSILFGVKGYYFMAPFPPAYLPLNSQYKPT
jgi:hypothetical protein